VASDPLLGATPERELSRSGSTRPHVLPRVEKRPNVGPFGAWYVFPMVLGRELELRAYGSHLVCEDKDDSVAWEASRRQSEKESESQPLPRSRPLSDKTCGERCKTIASAPVCGF